ncbi:MAG: cytochrome c biogenesis protein CcdA, partial [Candidatus Nanopelagicales bacterium]
MLLAFAAGIVSFASPCVLPLAPGYLSYVTGLTGAEIAGEESSRGRAGTTEGALPTRRATTLAVKSRVLLGSVLFVL